MDTGLDRFSERWETVGGDVAWCENKGEFGLVVPIERTGCVCIKGMGSGALSVGSIRIRTYALCLGKM